MVQPALLRADERLGRWYLLAKGAQPMLIRVSTVRDIKPKDPLPAEVWEAGVEACRRAFAQSGCSGALPDAGPVTVCARLHFERAPGMGAQFLRELRMGEVYSQEGDLMYRAEVNDPVELAPFLRAYSPWLSLEGENQGLRERIRTDLQEMREKLMRDG